MEAISTGVPGLDRVLCGGLRPRALHVVGGLPGTGKTTLAQQIAYHHARGDGGRVLYLAALSETAERLVGHASAFSFFDPAMVAERIYYISVYPRLEEGGLGAVLDEVRLLSLEHHATLVVLDGVSTLKAAAPSPLDFRRFVFDLNTQLRSLGVTSLFLGPWVELEATEPEFAVAEGIMTLTLDADAPASYRSLEVLKLRGSRHLTGRHSITITTDGLSVFPRLEAVVGDEGVAEPPAKWTRVSTGSEGLDRMLKGGLPSGSVTLLAGVPGAGKTALALSFLAEGGRKGEKGIYLGFDEAPSRLVGKADALGLGLGGQVAKGLQRLQWALPVELIPDRVAWQLLDLMDGNGVKRAVIDGADALLSKLGYAGRVQPFLAALAAILRSKNVTTIITHDLDRVVGTDLGIAHEGVASIVDNIIMLQYVELRSELHRLISIMKVRESGFDSSIREFTISEGGLHVASTFGSAEAVLTGIGHWRGRRAQ